MCDAFSSPIMSEMMRRISSGVRAPATRGSYAPAPPFQSTPFIFASKKWSRRAPRLPEHARLLAREVDVELRGQATPRARALERNRLDASASR